ncbi:MAG: hypothetical protein JWN52_5250 [Actinomycetia bacterium]|nr:hypothetical protein [Actinomycetes bacterium]
MSSLPDFTDPGMRAPLRLTISLASPMALARGSGYAHAWHLLRAAVHRGVLTVRPSGGANDHEISWPLPSDPSSVPRARRLIRGKLTDWGLDEQSEVAELLVSELVTNAVHYASGPVGLTLHSLDDTLRCEVEDTDTARPHMRRAHENDEGGRGLHMVELLSRRWGSEGTPTGKVVWFELSAHASPKAKIDI